MHDLYDLFFQSTATYMIKIDLWITNLLLLIIITYNLSTACCIYSFFQLLLYQLSSLILPFTFIKFIVLKTNRKKSLNYIFHIGIYLFNT